MASTIQKSLNIGEALAVGTNTSLANRSFTLPSLTTTQRNALTPAGGMQVYDSTLGKEMTYRATGWGSGDGTAAGSLDAAYNGGGTIAVDAAHVILNLSDSTNDYALQINNTSSGTIDYGLLIDTATAAAGCVFTDALKVTTSGANSTITDAIDVSDAGITNAINIGANAIIGSGGTINFDNFDVDDSTGNTTIGGTLDVTGAVTLSSTLALTSTLTSQGAIIVDIDDAEALLIRENGDAANVVIVDTTQDAGDTTLTVSSKTTSGKAFYLDIDTTTGQGLDINAQTVTSGDALRIVIASATMTAAGSAISVLDGATEILAVRKDGTLYVKGTAEGTTGGQLVTGDWVISDGDIIVSAGEASITSDTAGNILTLENTEAAATGVVIKTNHNSATPADNDVAFKLDMYADDDGGTSTEIGTITLTQLDVTAATDDAELSFAVAIGGALTEIMCLNDASAAQVDIYKKVSIEETAADQIKIVYDGSNDFGIDVDLDGSTTLTTTGTNADFEIASGTAGDITLDSTADIILEAAGGDITADAQVTITNTGNNQFVVEYDTSNYFDVDVDSDGSTTLTTTGTNADFEIATGTTADITLDASGDIILEAAGGDVNSDSPINITVAGGSQLELISAGVLKAVFDSAGTTADLTITASGGTTNIIELVGDKLVFDSAGDIDIEAAGNDINMDSPLNITDSGGSQLELISAGSLKAVFDSAATTADLTITASGGTTNVIELVGDTITLDSAGDIAFEAAGSDINMDAALNITITGTPQLELIESGSVKTTHQVAATTGAYTITSAGGNANHIELASGTAGNIILDSAGDIAFEAAGADITMDAQLTITNAADEAGLVLTNNAQTTTDGVDISSSSITTGALMKLNANAVTHDAEILELISAGDATSTPKGLTVTIASVTSGAAFGIDVTMVGATTTAKGIAVTMDALTEGNMLYLDNGGNSITTGYFINCNDDGAVKFGVGAAGATTIAGSAAGTDAFTITAGDIFLSDSDQNIIESEDGTTTTLLIDNKAGIIAADSAVLLLDAGGAVASGGNALRVIFSGTADAGAILAEFLPDAGSLGIKVDAGGVDTDVALYVDADPTANSVAYFHTDAVLAADKAVMEINSEGAGNADSAVLRLENGNTAGVSNVLHLKQDDVSEPFIGFESTSGAGNCLQEVAALVKTNTHYVMVDIEGVGKRYFAVGTLA